MTEAKRRQTGISPAGTLPRPDISPSSRIIQFADVRTTELKPGDRIEGVVTLKDLNTLADIFAVRISGVPLGVRKPGENTSPAKEMETLADYYQRASRRVNLNGNIRDFTITITPFGSRTVGFEARGDLYSTGRGKVSSIECEHTISVNLDGSPVSNSKLLNERQLREDARRVLNPSALAACDPGYTSRKI